MTHEIILRLTIQGEPLPKQRPRLGRGHAYTPERTREAELAIGWIAREKIQGAPGSWPVALTCRFYRANGRTADLDNLVKLVTDALNGIAWKDDRQVVQLHASRFDRQPQPRTEIEVYRCSGLGTGRS